MLDGVLEEFVEKLNTHVEPLKDQSQNLDRFSILFLLIGFFGITILAFFVGYAYSGTLGILLVVLYLVVLGMTFYRNSKELKILQ
mmetsp:Transcript_28896/g.43639  ORF Transcript_28896/g.43639 Transcript_28896/m.43639 type:complete len:85 (+) Transcript_28896:1210-1464(+)